MSCPATGDKEWVELVRLGTIAGVELEDELILTDYQLIDDKAVIWTGPTGGSANTITFPAGQTLTVIELSKHYLNNTGDVLTLAGPSGDPLDFVVIPPCAGAGLSFTYHPDGWQAGEPTRGSPNQLKIDPLPSPSPLAPSPSPSPTSSPIPPNTTNTLHPTTQPTNLSQPPTAASTTGSTSQTLSSTPTSSPHSPNLEPYLNSSYLRALSLATTLYPTAWAVLGSSTSTAGQAKAQASSSSQSPSPASTDHGDTSPDPNHSGAATKSALPAPTSTLNPPSLATHLFGILGGGLLLTAALLYASTLITAPTHASSPHPSRQPP